MDANFGVFPLAFCVAEGECTESWCWFMEQLHLHIGMKERRRVTFMSDRQKIVLNAIERCWPQSSNRYCVRHLIANLQKVHKGELNGLYVWNAANRRNKTDFLTEMENLKQVNEGAHDWLLKVPLKHWAVHTFDTHVKSNHTTNNITESFNEWVDKYRGHPSLSLLHQYLTKEAYLKTYSNVIHPIPDESMWPEVEHEKVLLPKKKTMPGRPKKNRKRALEDSTKKKRSGGVRCQKCGEWGHNKRTFKGSGKGSTSNKAKAGGSSKLAPKKKAKFGSTVTTVDSQHPTKVNALQGAGEPASQPMTSNALLQSSQQASQSYHSRSNPGTVAGLNVDWIGPL